MKTLEQATRIKESVELDLLLVPGVTGIDVGLAAPTPGADAQPVIRIYVDRQAGIAAGRLPSDVEGVPVVIIERRFELH